MRCRPETVAFVATAPLRAHASRVLPVPPDRVFEALADAPGWADWFPPVTAGEWTSSPPHGVGSTRSVQVGPGARIDEEFIVWEPGRRFGFTFTGATVPAARAGVELVELTPVDGGERTRITYTMALEPFGVPGVLARGARPALEAALAQGLKGLERYLTRG